MSVVQLELRALQLLASAVQRAALGLAPAARAELRARRLVPAVHARVRAVRRPELVERRRVAVPVVPAVAHSTRV